MSVTQKKNLVEKISCNNRIRSTGIAVHYTCFCHRWKWLSSDTIILLLNI